MATIESLVVRISGDASNLTKAVGDARSALGSLSSVGGLVSTVFSQLGNAILKSIKKEAFSKIKKEFDAFTTGIFEGIRLELERLGMALSNFLLGGNQGAIERFQNRIIVWLNRLIVLARQFVEGLDLGRMLAQLEKAAVSLASLADDVRTITNLITALPRFGEFIGERTFEATRNPTTAFGAGRSVIDLLRGLLERSTEQTNELKTQTNELRDLDTANARFG